MMEEIEIFSDSNDGKPISTLQSSEMSTPDHSIQANIQKHHLINSMNLFQNQLSDSNESGFFNETSRLQALEQEQEQLNASLMALTTHFGQVQFRLKQIVQAPDQDKERLLKELEEFAFRGCPNINGNKFAKNNFKNSELNSAHEQIIEEQRLKQKNLIDQLKEQLQDLETYAYQVNNQLAKIAKFSKYLLQNSSSKKKFYFFKFSRLFSQ